MAVVEGIQRLLIPPFPPPPWPSVVLVTQGSHLPPRWHLGSGPSAWLSWRREPPSSLIRWTNRYLGLQPGAAGWRPAPLN